MCTKIFLPLLLIFVSSHLYAQNSNIIKGSIKDSSDQKALANASVALLKAKDSSLIKISLTDQQGTFLFDHIRDGKYLLLASFTGHVKKYSRVILLPESDERVITFLLSRVSKSLKEVSVVNQKPFIVRKADKTILNVESSILNSGSNALQVIEAAPGVSLDKDDNISLKGKPQVNILIDGKSTFLNSSQLTDYLKSISASSIDQIEIISNPSSKYDASGNAGIINIKTKKNKTRGFNAGISTSYSQSVSSLSNNNANLNYRKGKVNVFATLSYISGRLYRDIELIRNFNDLNTGLTQSSFDQNSVSSRQNNNIGYKTGIDITLSKKDVLGFQFSGIDNKSKFVRDNYGLLKNGNNITDSSLFIKNFQDDHFINNAINLNNRYQFDSSGKELSADVDLIHYHSGETQLYLTDYYKNDGSQRKPSAALNGSIPSDINIYSLKMDYTLPVKHLGKFEAGIKRSYVSTDNISVYNNYSNASATWVTDYSKSNHFLYNELTNAAYLNYTKNLKKWQIQPGIRVENNIANGHQLGNIANQESKFNRTHTRLFPSLFINYEADKNNTFSTTIGRRINQPDYHNLNPFYYFVDEYSYFQGNTRLQPEITDNIEFTHQYKNNLTTTLSYSYTGNLMSNVFQQITSTKTSILTQDNIGNRTNIGISISATLHPFKTLTTNFSGNLIHNRFNGSIKGEDLHVQSTFYMFNLSNQFKFKKGWSMEVNGYYKSRWINDESLIFGAGYVNFGLQKEINKKATLKFSANDLLNTQNYRELIRFHEIDSRFLMTLYARRATITFNYRFGKNIKTIKRKTGGATEEQSRVSST